MHFIIQPGEFLLIINDGHHHWVTISTIGVLRPATIRVYDSRNDSFPSIAQAQVASIMCTWQSLISVEMMDVEKQVRQVASYHITFRKFLC